MAGKSIMNYHANLVFFALFLSNKLFEYMNKFSSLVANKIVI